MKQDFNSFFFFGTVQFGSKCHSCSEKPKHIHQVPTHTHIDLLCVRLITTKAELESLSKLCLM